jgi:hypothetical protein
VAPIERMLARTLQRYGAVVVNSSGSVAFYSENLSAAGGDPFNGAAGVFGGMKPSAFLTDLPWEDMQVLQTNMCNAIQPGSGLSQTPCSPPAHISPPANPNGCAPPASVTPQPGDTAGPSVKITGPTFPNVGARTVFSAYVSDPSGVQEVDFKVDGQLRFVSDYPHCAQNKMQYTLGGTQGFWDPTTEPRGTHALSVLASDSLGNQTTVSETVSNK